MTEQTSPETTTADLLALADMLENEPWHNVSPDVRPSIIAALRSHAQTPQQPVAWTNEAQLGYLKDLTYAQVPMAMWASRSDSTSIPLYAAPVPLIAAQSPRDAIIEECAKQADYVVELAKLHYGAAESVGAHMAARRIRALVSSTVQTPIEEPRFFIDHGMIHDRLTGKHVTTEPDSAFCDGILRCCDLLNALAGRRREPKSFPLLFDIDWLKKKIESDPDIECDAGAPVTRPDLGMIEGLPTGAMFECPECGGDLADKGHLPSCPNAVSRPNRGEGS